MVLRLLPLPTLILLVCFFVFAQGEKDTVVNHDFDQVFHGTFEYELKKREFDSDYVVPDNTDELKFDEIREKLKLLKYEVKYGEPAVVKLPYALCASTTPEILSYKEISGGERLLVFFRLTYKTSSRVSRRKLALALNYQDGISKAYINSATKQQIRTTINKKSAYKTAENQIVQYMNLSVQPCDDFYEYACGNFKTVHADDGVDSSFKLIAKPAAKVYMEFFKSKRNQREPRHERIARQYYAACTRYFDVEDDLIEYETKMYMGDVLEILGGLPLFDKNWNAEGKPCLSDVLAHLQIAQQVSTGLMTLHVYYNVDPPSTPEEAIDKRTRDYKSPDKRLILAVFSVVPETKDFENIVNTLQRFGKTVDEDQMFELRMLIYLLHSVNDKMNEEFRQHGFYKGKPDIMSVEEASQKFSLLNIGGLVESYQKLLTKATSTPYEFKKLYVGGKARFYLNELTKKAEAFPILFSPRNLRNLYLTSFMANLNLNVLKTEFTNSNGNTTVRSETVSQNCSSSFGADLNLIADRIYVDKYFAFDDRVAHEKKEVMLKMFDSIKKAYSEILESNWWLDDQSKDTLKRKVTTMESIMAYSDYLLEDDLLQSDILDNIDKKSSFFDIKELANLWGSVRYFELTQTFDLAKKTFVKSGVIHWLNAHFNHEHMVVMHAGIMNDPIYQYDAVMQAITYGYAGMVVGHEIGHALDNTNAYYDENGKWNKDHFDEREQAQINQMHQCIIKQYNGFCVSDEEDQGPHRCVSGGLTISENIPDAIGLHATLKAYKSLALTPNRFSGLLADKSAEQIFFLTFAQGQCGRDNKEDVAARVSLLDPHSPNKYRVNGAIQNTPAFGDAFNCPKNAKMAPVDHCHIWT